jgi:sugar lactone lactonase YvrE
MGAHARLQVVTAEVALDVRAEVGEGPVWDSKRGVLVWVDIYRGEVHLFDPASGGDLAIAVHQPVGAAATTASGDLILALRDGFARLDPASSRIEMLAEVESERPESLMNDGKCDRSGRFLAGTTTLSEDIGGGTLYRLNPDATVDRVLEQVTLSNGLDWSPDGRTMYFIDSRLQRIDAMHYDEDGAVGDRTTLVEIPTATGMPDGLTVDAAGYIWVALWGGSAVHRFTPEGVHDAVVELPVSYVTSCAFGGSDLGDLYITTSSWEFDESRFATEPHAGSVFVTRPGVPGLPPTHFPLEARAA